ncbi:MAG TPA: alpha/beta fold hydrolase, partial [Bacilli bacterium]
MQTTLSPLTLNPINPISNQPLARAPLRFHRLFKWLIIILLIAASFPLSAILAFNGYIAWTLGRPIVESLTSNPLEAVGLPYEDVLFNSIGGRSVLSGWYIPAKSGISKKTVIFSHGYRGNREEKWVPLYKLSQELHKKKYNVLMFDYGYVSPDQKRLMTAGALESKELLGAIDFIKNKGAEQIFIWGFSMGAGTALQTALHNTDITGMILDSTFLLEPETLKFTLLQQEINFFPIPPSAGLVRFFIPLLNGVSLKSIPYEEVKSTQYTMPIF